MNILQVESIWLYRYGVNTCSFVDSVLAVNNLENHVDTTY
jgi:hypothetical protein